MTCDMHPSTVVNTQTGSSWYSLGKQLILSRELGTKTTGPHTRMGRKVKQLH